MLCGNIFLLLRSATLSKYVMCVVVGSFGYDEKALRSVVSFWKAENVQIFASLCKASFCSVSNSECTLALLREVGGFECLMSGPLPFGR